MIRPFVFGDQHKLKFNEFSDPSDIEDVFFDKSYEKFVLEDNGEVKVIACWKEYEPDKWAAFFLMCEKISLCNCKELKDMITNATMRLKPKSVLTYSHDCDMLNRWHEFLGFKKEDENGLLVENKRFNKWVMEWA